MKLGEGPHFSKGQMLPLMPHSHRQRCGDGEREGRGLGGGGQRGGGELGASVIVSTRKNVFKKK